MKEASGGGYGIVYREIMRNSSIPPESKAIYAYLCSFAGSDGTCFPKVEQCKKSFAWGSNDLTNICLCL